MADESLLRFFQLDILLHALPLKINSQSWICGHKLARLFEKYSHSLQRFRSPANVAIVTIRISTNQNFSEKIREIECHWMHLIILVTLLPWNTGGRSVRFHGFTGYTANCAQPTGVWVTTSGSPKTKCQHHFWLVPCFSIWLFDFGLSIEKWKNEW